MLQGQEKEMPKRTMIYVDGLNLYYGALKGTPYRWLNLQKYFELVRPDDDIQLIHYFTAVVDPPHGIDQQTYLDALSTLPKLNIVVGAFIRKKVKCRVHACTLAQGRTFLRPEEKRTDVNIALQMLDDAYQGLAERFVLVTGDSDLLPAVQMVRLRVPQIEIVVYVPNNHPMRGATVELRNAAHKARNLPLVELRHAQFPTILPGARITKPGNW
jgi:6-hydroxy-3-succinoylpyridine 3-monooxygenase